MYIEEHARILTINNTVPPPLSFFFFFQKEIRDLGANFYLTEEDVANKTPRAQACIADLKSLNPFCKVEVWADAATPDAIAANG